MDVCARSACSRWKWSSSSSRLLGFILPLVVVTATVAFFGSKPAAVVSYPRVWNSVFAARGGTDYHDDRDLPEIVSPHGDGGGGVGLELRRRVVAGGEKEEALLTTGYDLNQSASPPLAVEAGQAEPPMAEVNSSEDEGLLMTAKPPSLDDVVLPSSSRLKRRKFSKLEIVEARLKQARATIRNGTVHGTPDDEYIPVGPVYWNATTFHRSYVEMEKQFKVYVYEEGEHPIFHIGPCGSIYSMEGNFMDKIEITKFRTKDPDSAHVFFLPFSVASIVHFIYDKKSQDHWLPMKQTVKDYVHLISNKYPYWNRSLGSDHFMLACHDWGPELSKSVPELYTNSIRALCNANKTEGFRPSKDVSIPEINLPGGRTNALLGGPSPSKRPVLAFFAGGLHGPIRPILLRHWENKDEDLQIHKYLPKNVSYFAMMRKSRYCICPSGYEVASPRTVEALYAGCVPVLMKDGYSPPFSDVLNWKSFSVEIGVDEIPNMKKILSGISTRQYIRMQRRGVQVRRHFEVNSPPKRYDVFHMTLHSIWLRRLNLLIRGRAEDL